MIISYLGFVKELPQQKVVSPQSKLLKEYKHIIHIIVVGGFVMHPELYASQKRSWRFCRH